VEAFVTWLKKQIDDKILEPVGIIDENWTTGFIRPAYQKGVIRAYTDTLPPAAARNRPFYAGGRATFLHEAFNSPVAVEKLRLIFTRDFEGLKGITADMSAKLGRILADGIARGRHPYDVARDMSKEIDGISRRRAEVLARTEIIHAHAEGQLDAMERLGLEEVKLMAEWVTAGDDRVCPLCAEKEGLVLPIKEAHGLIPLHPQCRCSWLPIVTEASRRRAFRAAPPPELAGATE
jgi:SPP1 gp7 family putative phage head morphogenesis protein